MDFAQQMLDEVERRCRTYQSNNQNYDECTENIEPIQTNLIENDNGNNEMASEQSETIYANSNIIKRNEDDGLMEQSMNIVVPVGKKPALPPKPQNRIEMALSKPKEFVQTACSIFDRKSPPTKKDPAEMTLKERLALFERNKGDALIPKAPLAMSVSTKQIMNAKSDQTLLLPHAKKSAIQIQPKSIKNDKPIVVEKSIEENNIENNIVKNRLPKIANQLNEVFDGFRNTSPKLSATPSTSQHDDTIDQHVDAMCTVKNKRRSGEIMIDNRMQVNDNIKRAKYANEVKLYGDLTPIVTSAPTKPSYEMIGLNDLHPNEPNCSLLDASQQTKDEDSVQLDRNDLINSSVRCKRNLEDLYDTSNDSLSIDDTFQSNTDDLNLKSLETTFQTKETNQSNKTFDEIPKTPENINEPNVLAHTLSVYRRKQTENVHLTIPKIIYPTLNRATSTIEEEKSTSGEVDKKMHKLLNDISIQHHHLIQTSHALNTCASTFEFSGSTEAVVAEWKLLVTTHCREAALNELSRLRSERTLNSSIAQESGRLTINEITLPLRQEYIDKLASDTIWGHHLVCLLKLKRSEQVVATKTIPTLPGLSAVKFLDTLELNVFTDFEATLEFYGMVAQREYLPHDIKYHIKPKKFGHFAIANILTPKSKKHLDSQFVQPSPSPSKQNQIRETSFQLFGSININVKETKRCNWPINELIDSSPLNGVVSMKIRCELAANIEHKGFLTMFEDVSGFGSWHRRWCYLNGHLLNYWKYPDDEHESPIGTIDLSLCKQKVIIVAPRDICARLNTILIELRLTKAQSIESLVSYRDGDEIIRRYLLSCDTKEDRIEWCKHMNKALQFANVANSKLTK